MGEYVININWNGGGGGGGSKGNTTPTSLLINPAAATEAATTIAAGAAATATNPAAFATFLRFANNKGSNQEQYIPSTPMDFISRNSYAFPVFSRDGKKN